MLEPAQTAASASPDEDTVIAFDRVSVIRNQNFLVRGLSWSVELDERWVVLGPNGAGKTTLLNLASGRLHPSRGTAWVLGERLGRTDINELRTRIGLATGQFAERVPQGERVLDVVWSRPPGRSWGGGGSRTTRSTRPAPVSCSSSSAWARWPSVTSPP